MPTLVLEVDPSLRFLLPLGRRAARLPVRADATDTLGHVVQAAGIPHTEVGALRLDGVPAVPGDRIREGVLAVDPIVRPEAAPTDPPRFLLDVHLGALARRMRVLGLDVAYDRAAGDAELTIRAAEEQRVLLSQDRGLLKRAAVRAGALVRGEKVEAQLDDVLERFAPPLSPWTRCALCNGTIRRVALDEVRRMLEPGTARTYAEFGRCDGCGRVYWRGAHDRRLRPMVEHAEQVVAAARSAGQDEYRIGSARTRGLGAPDARSSTVRQGRPDGR